MDKYKRRLSRSFSLMTRSTQQEGDNAGGGSPWKFWRRFSTRARSERSIKADSRDRERPEITLLESPAELEQSPECLKDNQPRSGPLSGPLPDVVEKAPGATRLVGPNGVAPPKPPRLFLYRTPSNVSKNSKSSTSVEPTYSNGGTVAGEGLSDRSVIVTQPEGSSSLQYYIKGGENNNLPEQITRNSRENTASRTNTTDSPFKTDKSYVNSHITAHSTQQNSSSSSSPAKPSAHTETKDSLREFPNVPNHQNNKSASTQGLLAAVASKKHKIKSPDLSSRRHHHARSRRRSHDKTGGSDARSRQRHIMLSIMELLRQSLDPYPLLEPLKRAGVLTNMDVQSFLGHRDRKSVCEGLVDVVGDAGPQGLNVFSDVLANTGTCSEIFEVLQVMREMDRIVNDVAHAPLPPAPLDEEEEAAVTPEEKSLRYEVGYLSLDHTLKPLVELERAQHRLSKTSSSTRNSAYSLLETSGEPGNFPGLVMVNVCVAGHNLSGPRAHALASLLTDRRCVCELRVGKTRLEGRDVAVLSAALQDNSTVTALDLRLNSVDQTGAEALEKLLKATRTLRELNLSSCGLSKEDLGTIIAAVGVNRSLFDLDLSFLDITDGSAPYLRDMLRANTGLQKLRLRSNNLTWTGCYAIAEGLTRSMGLQVLDLSRNNLGDAGMQALAKFLPDTQITELYVESCGVTATGCDSLGEVIARCKRLKTLDASTNLLTDLGVSKLSAALERSSSIQNVGLNICGVTNDGFSRLLDMLEKNTSVLQVKLCYNSLGSEEHSNPQATADNLRYRLRIVTSSRPKLKILLWGNPIDED